LANSIEQILRGHLLVHKACTADDYKDLLPWSSGIAAN
jgi:hypothetical protein